MANPSNKTPFNIAQQEADATARLNTAQSEFKKLKAGEAKYIEERETRANEKLAVLDSEIENARRILDTIIDEITKASERYGEKLTGFADGMNNFVDRADGLLETAQNLRETGKRVVTELHKRVEKVDEAQTRLSEWEVDLKKREKGIEKKSKQAKADLTQAEDLAYWHRSGKTYTEK